MHRPDRRARDPVRHDVEDRILHGRRYPHRAREQRTRRLPRGGREFGEQALERLMLSLFHPIDGVAVLFIKPETAIVGALAGYLSLWSIYQLFRLMTGKEGMGYGDFKLLAVLGAWLGWQMVPLIILLSAVVGAAVGITMIIVRRHDRSVPIPFGPYLAAAGWIAMMWGDQIIAAYLDIMS